jgi:transcriptional regulator with XRE-family HTH domain
MNETMARQFGEYLHEQRSKQHLTIRALAARAGVDTATLVRLEHGKYRAPRPDTLKGIATALGLPLADVFALANYVVPYDLPSFSPYLRAKYGDLPAAAIADLDSYFRDLVDQHHLDLKGPAPGEDEDHSGKA